MAISRDTSADLGLQVATTTFTAAYTTGATADALVVSCFGDVLDKITGCTFNGNSLSLVAKLSAADGSERWNYLFLGSGPPIGTYNVVISASAAIAMQALAVSYIGVDQTGGIQDAFGTGSNASTTTLTVGVTSISDNCWIVGSFRANSTGMSAGAGANQLQAAAGQYLADSNGPKTPAGLYQMTYTNGSAVPMSGILVALKPQAPPPGHPMMRRWGGVPAVGSSLGIGNKGVGRMWGRRRSGIIVPHRFREVA